MTAPDPKSVRQRYVFKTFLGGTFINQTADRVDMTVGPTAAPTADSTTDGDIEVPAGTPFIDHAMNAAIAGTTTFLTRYGRRVAAVVPAHVAESLAEAAVVPDDEEAGGEAGDRPERRFDALCREQGFGPVTDPSTLLGEPFDDFDEFYAAATRGYR